MFRLIVVSPALIFGLLRSMGVSIVSNFNDLAGFGAFMVSLWGLLPDIVRGLILAVAALFVIIGVIQLID